MAMLVGTIKTTLLAKKTVANVLRCIPVLHIPVPTDDIWMVGGNDACVTPPL